MTRRAWNIDTASFVPSDQGRFMVEGLMKFKWVIKFLKRRFVMMVLGQGKRELLVLPERGLKVLWINRSAPSIGDALMDLSGRELLRGHELHLFGYSNYANLFEGDRYFSNVYCELRQLFRVSKRIKFDVVILDSFAVRSVLVKFLVAPGAPCVSMYGYLNGFEVHRTIYSFSRIAKLLNYRGCLEPRPILELGSSVSSALPPGYVAIAIGAEWDFRNYHHWETVIRAMSAQGHQIVLIGSENGSKEALRLQKLFPGVGNYVGKCSLKETASIIREAAFLLAADGGLWHIACALDKRSVGLFADCQLFDARGIRTDRSTDRCRSITLYAENYVSQIPPAEVIKAVQLLLERYK